MTDNTWLMNMIEGEVSKAFAARIAYEQASEDGDITRAARELAHYAWAKGCIDGALRAAAHLTVADLRLFAEYAERGIGDGVEFVADDALPQSRDN